MPNSIEYADILQKELDQQMLAESTTGWMDANAGEVIITAALKSKCQPSAWMGWLTIAERKVFLMAA